MPIRLFPSAALILLVPAVLLAQIAPGEPDQILYEADFSDGDAHGWGPTNNLEPFTFTKGCLSTTATGHDAHMTVGGLSLPTSAISHVRFRLRSDKPGVTQVYFATTASPDPAAHPVPGASCPGDGQWHDFEVLLAGLEGFTGSLTMLRLDPVNGGGEQAQLDLAWVRLVRKAPALVPVGFAATAAVLEPGRKTDLTLALTNLGGPTSADLRADLETSGEVTVAEPSATVRLSPEDGSGRVTWRITARQPGLAALSATVHLGDRLIVSARTALPVLTPADLRASAGPAAGRELANDRLSLLFVAAAAGQVGAAVVRVRDGATWKPVGLLSPLAQVVHVAGGVERSDDPCFSIAKPARAGNDALALTGMLDGARVVLTLSLAPRADEVAVTTELTATSALAVRRFSGPVFRVGFGRTGDHKTAAVFPGLEFLGENEPSSSEEVVGETAGYRPRPPAYQVTVPVLAVLKDDVLCGLMWDPLRPWNAEGDVLPVPEFASPNFLDGQANHRLACFVADKPDRGRNQPVTARPHALAEGGGLVLETRLFAAPGGDIVDAVPRWYAAYGLPTSVPPPCSPEEALDLCIQGWAQTLWFPKERGFNNHWHVGQSPYWDGGLAANILDHGLRTGERRWTQALDLKPDATILSLAGSLFTDLKLPSPPASLATQNSEGLWPYVSSESVEQRTREFTNGKRSTLGRPGELNVGVAANNALPLLSHALRWGDQASLRAGLKALDAMERFRVPRGCQGWEVQLDVPDIYAAARIMDCYRLGYELTGQRHYLDRAFYWAYTGLPFLYSYEVPNTGPGASAHIPWPEDIVGPPELVFRDPDAHHPTPWGSIPVFGTSFYRVSWFGNLVQWCGLCWAKSVYPLLELRDDRVLRAAADGVVYSGIHQTFDQEPYVGLLPDTWHLSSNTAHPAFIGPVRLEDPLRMMIHRPPFGYSRTRVALRGAERAHVTSYAWLSDLRLTGDRLTWVQRFPVGQTCETVVILAREPKEVRVSARSGDNLEPLPHVADLTTAEEGWCALPGVGGIGLRVRHDTEDKALWVTF